MTSVCPAIMGQITDKRTASVSLAGIYSLVAIATLIMELFIRVAKGMPVISHVFIGVNNFERAFAFYSGLMHELGLVLKFNDAAKPWAAWHAAESPRPLFIIGGPFDHAPAVAGNGQMVALLAASADMVNRCHAMALSAGAQCEGAPGLRPHYHAQYYGAYLRDLDGNKICICYHG